MGEKTYIGTDIDHAIKGEIVKNARHRRIESEGLLISHKILAEKPANLAVKSAHTPRHFVPDTCL